MRISRSVKLELSVIVSVVLGFFLAFFVFTGIEKESLEVAKQETTATALNATLDKGAPQYFYVNNALGTAPKVSAQAYLVGDLGTGEIILRKNETLKLPIASISKLLTALVATEITKQDDTAKISKRAVSTHGGNGELRNGEMIKVSDLVYPLLLESSNDAAEAIAEFFGRDAFISEINETAQSLKMTDTSFEDPSGLSEKNQSTAADIFKLSGYLVKQRHDLLDITALKNYSNKKHNWSNISQFLSKDGYLGGKSGYIDESLQTVISVFSLPLGEHVSRPIAITLLKSKDRARDVDSILKYLKKNIYYGGLADANTDWIREKLLIQDIDQGFVDMIFTGDIMLDRGVESSVNKNLGGNYGKLFEKTEILKKADIVFGNLEGTASDKGQDMGSLYSFRMDPAVIPALKGASFSIMSLANNHIADWGILSYMDTLSRLKENEILYTGGGMHSKEAETPVIIEKHGMKIGFLGFSDVGPSHMRAGAESAGILLASNPRFNEIVQNAAKQVDYLVVSFHFGEEYKPIHNKRQEELAHKAIDNGAKIVVGHHPHVAQDFEVYTPESCTQSSCMGYIMYSLGNFIFDQKFSKATMQGLLVQIRLDKYGNMSVIKNTTEQNKLFQIERIVKGKEEKIKFTSQ